MTEPTITENQYNSNRKIFKQPIKIALLIILFFGVLVSLFFVERYLRSPRQLIDNNDFVYISAQIKKVAQLAVPDPEAISSNPLTGKFITEKELNRLEKKDPIAVVINNHADARPQSGLTLADTVLEVLAEGGITRYVALFYGNQQVEKIGPVRSLRYYMIEWASGYSDAVILHHGWAGFDNAPFETYREQTDARGAVARYGIKSLQSAGSAYRDLEKAASAGYVHSLYTGFEYINSELEAYKNYGWEYGSRDLEPLTYKNDLPKEKRGNFGAVTIDFISLSGSDYQAKFTYDKKTNTYPRFIGGTSDIDELTGKQIAPKNVIIEWHEYRDAQDGHARLIIEMIGEGEAEFLVDGKRISAIWEKECRLCRTRYYDKSGEELALNRGQTWISVAIKNGETLVSDVNFE